MIAGVDDVDEWSCDDSRVCSEIYVFVFAGRSALSVYFDSQPLEAHRMRMRMRLHFRANVLWHATDGDGDTRRMMDNRWQMSVSRSARSTFIELSSELYMLRVWS